MELREHNAALEIKNKKYLEIIGMTASQQQEDIMLQIEAAQEALTFTKRAKRLSSAENNCGNGEDIQILEEMEEMLEQQ